MQYSTDLLQTITIATKEKKYPIRCASLFVFLFVLLSVFLFLIEFNCWDLYLNLILSSKLSSATDGFVYICFVSISFFWIGLTASSVCVSFFVIQCGTCSFPMTSRLSELRFRSNFLYCTLHSLYCGEEQYLLLSSSLIRLGATRLL